MPSNEPAGLDRDIGWLGAMALLNVRDAVVISIAEPIDEPGPQIIYVNPAFERMTGYAAHEVLGKTPRILQGPGTDSATRDRIRSALKAWQPVRETVLNYRKDGSEIWVELDITPVADDTGSYTHWIAVQRNVTARKTRELAIPNLVNRLQGVVYTFRMSPDGKFAMPFVSDEIASIFGVTPEEVRDDASKVFERIHPDDIPALVAANKRSAEDLSNFQWSFRTQQPDGRWVRLLATASPARLPDGSTLWHGYFTDLGSTIEFPHDDVAPIIDAIPAGVFVKDATSKFLLMNSAAEEQFGVLFGDVDGTDGSSAFPADQVASFNAADRAVFERRRAIDFEEEHWNDRLKVNRISHTYKRPIFDSQGNPKYIVGVSFDITAQKHVENSLRASEQKLRSLFDLSDVGFVLGAMDGRYIDFNRAFQELLGYSREELLTLRYQDITPKEHDADDQAQLERMLATRDYPPREKEYLRKDGTRVSVRIRGAVVEGDDGQLYRWAIVEDITAQKRQQRMQAYLAAIVASSADAILGLDFDGNISAWNPAAEAMFGYSAEEILGQPGSTLVPARLLADFEADLGRLVRGERITQAPSLRKRRNGDEFPVMHTLSAMYDERGKAIGTSITIRDTTDQIRMEEQLRQSQKMEAVGKLTGGLAHDFNNLLGIIIGNIDFLKNRVNKTADDTEIIDDIVNAANQGAELTKSLLAFARRQPLEPKVVNLRDLIDDTVKLLRRLLGEDIDIVTEHEIDLCAVRVDPTLLAAALTNLATNARDAMPSGGVLTIGTKHRRVSEENGFINLDIAAGDYAVIVVSDTGHGIAPELISRIFEPFFTTKERDRGTGLGLSMVFGFMKQSGGHINVYSEPGQGTAFRLYLPCDSASQEKSERSKILTQYNGNNEKVLIVEDNISLRRVLKRQLADLGYSVLEAANGEEALAILPHASIDLLFSDVVMPGGMDGYQLAAAVQARWPSLKIILTSGFPERRSQEPAPETRFRLITKPYRKGDLARLFREVLDAPAPP